MIRHDKWLFCVSPHLFIFYGLLCRTSRHSRYEQQKSCRGLSLHFQLIKDSLFITWCHQNPNNKSFRHANSCHSGIDFKSQSLNADRDCFYCSAAVVSTFLPFIFLRTTESGLRFNQISSHQIFLRTHDANDMRRSCYIITSFVFLGRNKTRMRDELELLLKFNQIKSEGADIVFERPHLKPFRV